MYGQRHPLAFQSAQAEKYVGNLTGKQLLWLVFGGSISYKLMQIVPVLPFESMVFRHLHHFLPLIICAIFGFAKEGKTGLPLFTYFLYWIAFHRRSRTLVYKRGSNDN